MNSKMKYQRKFIVKVLKFENNTITFVGFIKKIYNGSIGKFYSISSKKENAKIWKYKKNCENKISFLKDTLDPTKSKLKKYDFEIIEITDKQTLRKIKLKKLKK